MNSFLGIISFENKMTQDYRRQFAVEQLHLWLTVGVVLNVIALGFRASLRVVNWGKSRSAVKDKSVSSDEELLPQSEYQAKTTLLEKILDSCAGVASWAGFCFFAGVPAWYWGFKLLNFWVAVLLSMIILSVRLLWGLFYHKMAKNRAYLITMGIFIVFYSVGASVALEGASKVWHEDTYGLFGNKYTTRILRQWQLPTMCPPGPPCHVYATLPEDASTSVFITAQTSLTHPNVSICWQPSNSSNSSLSCANSTRFELTDVEPKGQRYIHSAYIGNLTSDTLYDIQVVYFDSDMEKLSEKYDFIPMDYHHATGGYLAVIENYRTLPNNQSNKEITIVMGGDAGPNQIAAQIAQQAAAYKPDVIVVSGDVAYDNALRTAYYVYDGFLDLFKPVYKQKGWLVPLVLGAGNHDIGKDSMSQAVVNPDDYAPLWYLMFPQHSIRAVDGSLIPGVPNMTQRKTYFYNRVGNLLLVSLDAGYQESFSGPQLKWWKSVNDNHTGYAKFANYHNPIYWSSNCPTTNNVLDSAQVREGMTYWAPELDRSGYRSAWENHVHVFKRTFPIKGGLIDETGTIYLGDGVWGADPGHSPLCNETGIMATFNAAVNQFWVVHVNTTNNTIVYSAVDNKGVMFDQATQKLFL